MDESESHHVKHSEQKISTLRGIFIVSMDELEKTENSICVNREFDSNEIDESERHPWKHSEQRISTLFGIIID
jgi:hypothetical protein